MAKDISTITTIQSEKAKEIAAEGRPSLTPEIVALAERKRESFDIPINAVTIDPLR